MHTLSTSKGKISQRKCVSLRSHISNEKFKTQIVTSNRKDKIQQQIFQFLEGNQSDGIFTEVFELPLHSSILT